MPSSSEIILSANTHPGDSTVQSVTGDNFKGDGYYGRADGVHTVQATYTDFVGTITIQGTLATTPTDSDWFTVHEFTETSATKSVYANFTGNYTYIRAKLSYTAGSITSVLLNH